jgi:lipopolysaccharide transport system permease protein
MDKTTKPNSSTWDLVIKPQSSLFNIPWGDIWRYRDLLRMFIRRDIVTVYKQTILGLIWYVVQPILTSLIQMLIFGRIANISTDGTPQFLFYLAGNTLWLYFSESFNNTAKTFKDNENIFGKVYFPRLIMPLSKVIGGLIKFAIQFTFFLIVYFYLYYKGATIQPQKEIILLPLLLVLMAGYGLGAGIIFSSLTTKYRDLTFLLQFGVQLLMYASSVIVPFSAVPEKYKPLIAANPLVHIIETFKYMFLGVKGPY